MTRQFEHLYLTPKEDFRVALLSDLKIAQQQPGQGLNLKALAERKQLNYSTVYHSYTRLLKDLAAMSGSQSAAPATIMTTSEAELSWYFVQQSVPYQLLSHLLANDLQNFDEFLRLTTFSRVTVLRRLQALRQLARSLKVRIIYETMQMVGSESAIRIFLTVAFGEATQGCAWPFASVSRPQAARLVAQMYEQVDLDFHNPIVQESQTYLAAVTIARIQLGMWQNDIPETITTPVSNFFELDRRLTKTAQIAESQVMFLLNVLTAVYTGPRDPQVMVMLMNQTHFDPAIRGFVKRIIQQLPKALILRADSALPLQPLIEASLLASVVGVVILGYDVSDILACQLNRNLMQTPADPALQAAVREACNRAADEVVVPKAVGKHFSAIVKAVYANSLQLRRYLAPARPVKVGLMLAPIALQYVDLLAFLTSQAAVQIVDVRTQPCDILIVASALPMLANHAPSAIVIHWQPKRAQALMNQLFTLIQKLQHQQ